MSGPNKPMDRLKVLINSSTPIVVMETVEELRAVRMVRVACNDLNLATFEWSIASRLARCGAASTSPDPQFEDALPPGGYDSSRHTDAEQNTRAISPAANVVEPTSQTREVVHPDLFFLSRLLPRPASVHNPRQAVRVVPLFFQI